MKDKGVLLTIPNYHKLDPPKIEDGPDQYVGYYCNLYGEQMLFVFDRTTNRGTLYHGDVDWQPYPVRDGVAPGLILHEAEELWLRACWLAAVPVSRG